jgi:regulator of replication initiation timing
MFKFLFQGKWIFSIKLYVSLPVQIYGNFKSKIALCVATPQLTNMLPGGCPSAGRLTWAGLGLSLNIILSSSIFSWIPTSVASLEEEIIDLKEEIVDLKEEIIDLKEEIVHLKSTSKSVPPRFSYKEAIMKVFNTLPLEKNGVTTSQAIHKFIRSDSMIRRMLNG